MLIAVLLLLVSVGLLVAGAELFVENAAAVAGRLGVTLLAVAALVRPLPIGPRTRLSALGSALAGVGLAVMTGGGALAVDGAGRLVDVLG